MIYTTLNKIREHSPCADGWKKLLKYLGKESADDEPLNLVVVIESNGLDDCVWCLRSVPEYNHVWRMYAVWCARQVRHLMTDARSLAALDVAWAHANGLATDEELATARAIACDVVRTAALGTALGTALDAELDTEWDTARAAEWNAARAVARATTRTTALGTALDTVLATTGDAALAAQKNMLIAVLQHPENAKMLLGETT